ncbi:MAG: MATE family efflux transporter, partial [Patescibacteria group bacterium]
MPDYTKGPIIKALVGLSLPIVFANILQTAYQLIDTFWVGRLGAVAVAAVSLSFPVIFLMISLGGGLAIAGTILVAQYKGQGNRWQVDHVSGQTLLLMLVSSAAVSVLGYLISGPVMKLIGAGPEVLPEATSYLQISFIGMVFMFGFFVFQSLMRGVGDVKTPLYIVLATVLMNLVLDPLFILGWGPVPAYGVSGAAIATVGTQGVAAVIGLFLLFSGRYGIHLKPEHLRFDLPLFKKMFNLG